MVLTPVSPHMLFDRSLVLEPDEWLRLTVLEGGAPRPCIDGARIVRLTLGDAVVCRAAAEPARLVSFGARRLPCRTPGPLRSDGSLSEAMLVELRVRDLGVIADLDLVIGPGMTALTGETGAGKTLVVEALELLVGGRADATMVRAGAEEAVVEGRFVDGEREVVLAADVPICRTIPRVRRRSDGAGVAAVRARRRPRRSPRPARTPVLAAPAGTARRPRQLRRSRSRAGRTGASTSWQPSTARLAELGGDPRALARTVDLLRFQLDEIGAAAVAAPDEDERACGRGVGARPGRGDPGRHRGGTCRALGARRLAGTAAASVQSTCSGGPSPSCRPTTSCPTSPPASTPPRPISTTSPTSCVCAPTRSAEDPERLEAVRARLRLFVELRRKYGSSLAEVVEFERSGRAQLADLEGAEETRAALERQRSSAAEELRGAEERLGTERRQAAPKLAASVEAHLHELALPAARLEVRIGDDPGRG